MNGWNARFPAAPLDSKGEIRGINAYNYIGGVAKK